MFVMAHHLPILVSAILTPIPVRGLYIPNTDAYPAHFRGMGIRIEDSVCVEDDHPLVLTTEAVKEVCTHLSTMIAVRVASEPIWRWLIVLVRA